MGFTSSAFKKGQHTSDKEFDLEHFKSFQILETMGYIRREKLTSSTIEMEQIEGKPHISELLVYIAGALQMVMHDVSMVGKENNTKMEYEILPPSKRIILSKFLNNYLGLPDNFYFEGEGTINIPPQIIDPTLHDLLLMDSQSSSKIIVTTEIIRSQFYGEQELKILSVFNRINNKDSEVQHKASPIVYKQLDRQRLSEIGISIVSDTGEFTSFSRNPTTLTLHFRKIKL